MCRLGAQKRRVFFGAHGLPGDHGNYMNPLIIAGGCGGYFKTGRVVKLGSWAGKTGAYYRGASGVANNKLLATLSNAMDVPVAGFGDPKYSGMLTELVK